MFLNEEKKPFKDLFGEEMKIVVDAIIGGSAEYFNQIWVSKTCTGVYLAEIYRVPPRKTKIDWSCFDKSIKAIARSSNDSVYGYDQIPVLNEASGNFENGLVCAFCHLSDKVLQIGDEPWQESLIERPEGE